VLVGLTVLAGLVAILPIVGAMVAALAGGDGSPGAPRTAFATAPVGEYAVVARNGQDADVIFVAPASNPDAASEIARIPHLPGFASTGAVSPEGRRLALVAADAGTPARPGGSLYLLDLETAALTRLAIRVDYLQTPVWSPDGRDLVFTRTVEGDGAAASVAILRVAVDGSGERQASTFERVLGAYAVGFDPSGRLVTVVIDGRGSTAYRDDSEAAHLSTQITRDWKLSPDGSRLAFIESDTSDGLQYRSSIVSLDGGTAGEVAAQSASGDGGQQLGVAWKPGAPDPTFGREPVAILATEGVSAQAVTGGFDVPVAFSPGGSGLAVQHWSGPNFGQAGKMSLQVVADDGSRTSFDAFTRFYGWATR